MHPLRSDRSYCRLSDYNFGYLGYQSEPDSNAVQVQGYPAVPSLGVTYPSLMNGAGLYNTRKNRLLYTADTTGGQSGGPVLVYSYVTNRWSRASAIHHGGFTQNKNQGRRIKGLVSWFKTNSGY